MRQILFLKNKTQKQSYLYLGSFTGSLLLFFGILVFSVTSAFSHPLNDTLPQRRTALPQDTLPVHGRVSERDTLPTEQILRVEEEGVVLEDTTAGIEKKEDRYKEHSPLKATMLSVTLPGLGQAYNNRYWKIPIIYAGFGTIAYFWDMNNTEYQTFRRAWVARVDGNPNTVDEFPFYSTDQLQRATNFYRRNLEITYILGFALYVLNILDATVDAHLLDFDVSEDLTMSVRPSLIPEMNPLSGRQTSYAAMKFTFRF